VSRLRWRDVDLAEGTIRFREKGGKVSVKPMPDELRAILRAAVESMEVSCGPDDYVIPEPPAGKCPSRGTVEQGHLGDGHPSG
jgi:integrase